MALPTRWLLYHSDKEQVHVADRDCYQEYYFSQYYSSIAFASMKLTLLKHKQTAHSQSEIHPVKKLSCTDQKCNRGRQALRVFQSLWGCINLKSCYIKEKNVWESLPVVTLD